MPYSITFDDTPEFAAKRAAEAWCRERGISAGPCQQHQPRGLATNGVVLAKWRNLNDSERRQLDGQMTGDMRHGPVTVTLNRPLDEFPIVPEEWR